MKILKDALQGPKKLHMHTNRLHSSALALLGCCLLGISAACGSHTPPMTSRPSAVTVPATPSAVTAPATPAGCPATGTARAVVTAPLPSGSHQNVVYTMNEGTYDAPVQATLIRYDVVTGMKTRIATFPRAFIDKAELSADGQWLLLAVDDGTGSMKLKVVRVDGQGLQTLYCAQDFGGLAWSPNREFIVFSTGGFNSEEDIYLLDMASGALQVELSVAASEPGSFVVVHSWLDNTRLYLTNSGSDQATANKIYLLDTSKGARQHLNDLVTVFQEPFGSFASSVGGSSLFIDHGGCGMASCLPPSSITEITATGGPERTIFNSTQFDVVQVQAISQKTLLLVIVNDVLDGPIDRSHNGLWKINTDGTGLTRLTTDDVAHGEGLVAVSASRDGSMYASEVSQGQTQTQTYSLLFGSLSGGTPTTFVSVSSDQAMPLDLVGWTTV